MWNKENIYPYTMVIAVRYHIIRTILAMEKSGYSEHLITNQIIADGLTKVTNHIIQGQLVDNLGLA